MTVDAADEITLNEADRYKSLAEQFFLLSVKASKEVQPPETLKGTVGTGIGFGPYYFAPDAQRWHYIYSATTVFSGDQTPKDLTAQGVYYAHNYANIWLLNAQKEKAPTEPEFTRDATTRLGHELREWALKTGELWTGKAFLTLRSYRRAKELVWFYHLGFHPSENGETSEVRLNREFIELLESVGTNGKSIAAELGGSDPWGESKKVPGMPRWAAALAFALWHEKIRPEIVRSRAIQHVRIPRDLAGALVQVRTSGTIIDIPLGKVILVTPAKNVEIGLPWHGHTPNPPGTVDIRQILSASMLKAWVYAFALWTMQREHARGTEAEDMFLQGVYMWEPNWLLREFGNTYEEGRKRANSKSKRDLDAAHERLGEIHVAQFGQWKTKKGQPPEPLVRTYEHIPGEQNRPNMYRHAGLAFLAMKNDFARMPVETLGMDAADYSRLLGVSTYIRDHVTHSVTKGPGHIAGKLDAVLADIGVDVAETKRQARWIKEAKHLVRITSEGGFGACRVTGEGPAAEVIIEPSEQMVTGYEGLFSAAEKNKAEAVKAKRRGRGKRVATGG